MAKHRKCTICCKPIVLVPSAAERSRKTGKPASYFLNLFTEHARCTIDKRNRDTLALIERMKAKP